MCALNLFFGRDNELQIYHGSSLLIFFFGRDNERRIYHGSFILMDNKQPKHGKLFVVKQSLERSSRGKYPHFCRHLNFLIAQHRWKKASVPKTSWTCPDVSTEYSLRQTDTETPHSTTWVITATITNFGSIRH